jgi:hypothetical protein
VPLRSDVLSDPRFWVGIHVPALGMISPDDPDIAAYCSSLGVTEDDSLAWFGRFAGPFLPGSEGMSDDPALVRLPLAGGIHLNVEIHPGDQYWRLHDQRGAVIELANVGPHFRLPGLRWAEAVQIACAAPARQSEVLLLTLPTVWLTDADDLAAVCRSVAEAWVASGLASPQPAERLAGLWASAVAGGRDYPWRQDSAGGWVCTAEWSSRSVHRPVQELVAVNRMVAAARPAA